MQCCDCVNLDPGQDSIGVSESSCGFKIPL